MSLLEKENNKFGLTMLISWIIFGVWEVYVFYWAKEVVGPIIRLDLLLILPALLIISSYWLWQITTSEIGIDKNQHHIDHRQ